MNNVAKGLLAIGVKKGDKVAIWATNYPQWILLQFATARIGAILVTVNTNYKTYELKYILQQSDSMTLVLSKAPRKAITRRWSVSSARRLTIPRRANWTAKIFLLEKYRLFGRRTP